MMTRDLQVQLTQPRFLVPLRTTMASLKSDAEEMELMIAAANWWKLGCEIQDLLDGEPVI